MQHDGVGIVLGGDHGIGSGAIGAWEQVPLCSFNTAKGSERTRQDVM